MSFTVSGIIATVERDGEIAFKALANDIDAGAKAIGALLSPTLQEWIDKEASLAKQFASDAISMADTTIASHQQSIALATEQAIDGQLSIATKGASIPFNEMTNHFIDELVAAAVAAAHNAGMLIKSRLAASTTGAVQPAPQLSVPPTSV